MGEKREEMGDVFFVFKEKRCLSFKKWMFRVVHLEINSFTAVFEVQKCRCIVLSTLFLSSRFVPFFAI